MFNCDRTAGVGTLLDYAPEFTRSGYSKSLQTSSSVTTPASTTANPADTAPPSTTPTGEPQATPMPLGVIVGGSIGGVAAIGIIGLLAFFLFFRRKNNNNTPTVAAMDQHQLQSPPSHPQGLPPTSPTMSPPPPVMAQTPVEAYGSYPAGYTAPSRMPTPSSYHQQPPGQYDPTAFNSQQIQPVYQAYQPPDFNQQYPPQGDFNQLQQDQFAPQSDYRQSYVSQHYPLQAYNQYPPQPVPFAQYPASSSTPPPPQSPSPTMVSETKHGSKYYPPTDTENAMELDAINLRGTGTNRAELD
jgi:hypothetical protein